MERAAPLARLGGEFDAFLFSSIGYDSNGIPLSVVSLLARRDLDPWLEASNLADLPAEAAALKLTSWIRTIADPLLALPDPGAMATRLVALLPRRLDTKVQRVAKPEDAAATAPKNQQTITALVLVAIYLILMIGSQLAMTHPAPPAQANTASAQIAPNQPATDALPPPAK